MKKHKRGGRVRAIKYEVLPYREKEYGVFIHWKSLPTLFRGDNIAQVEAAKKMGFSDFDIELMQIKTQREFCKRFALNENTVSDWNQLEETDTKVRNRVMEWAKGKFPNVAGAHYKQLITGGQAALFDSWYRVFEGIKEEKPQGAPVQINIALQVFNLLKMVGADDKTIKKLGELIESLGRKSAGNDRDGEVPPAQGK